MRVGFLIFFLQITKSTFSHCEFVFELLLSASRDVQSSKVASFIEGHTSQLVSYIILCPDVFLENFHHALPFLHFVLLFSS